MRRLLTLLCCLIFTGPALAEPLCIGQNVAKSADGRMLGHIPYPEISGSELIAAPPGFALGQPCFLQRDAARGLAQLLAGARAQGVTGLVGISCFRSVARQRAVFCSQIGPGKACRDAAERARSVGPPGFSEHATGYALDFGVRPSPGCRDLDACVAQTRAGRWLLDHAPEYGFELSFPDGNAQGVTWEPWHWRWVGVDATAAGADFARALFTRARRDYAALPAVDGGTGASRFFLVTPPPHVETGPIPTTIDPVCFGKKCR